MSEKRHYTRVSLHTEIWLGQDGVFTRTQRMLRDLSVGGAYVETPEQFSVGSVLSLRFVLPGTNGMISCAVLVRNVRKGGSGLGVEFLDLSQDARQLVGAFVGQENQV